MHFEKNKNIDKHLYSLPFKSINMDLPRCWPILYSLYKKGEIQGHFYLQKYLYLAKVEGKVPMDYEFIKEDYGPYSIGIKSDAFLLNRDGFIEMRNLDGKWVFTITEKGKNAAKKMLEKLSKRDITHFDKILEKFGSYSHYELKNYVYKSHIRDEKTNKRLKSQMLIDIMDLTYFFRDQESSSNSLFVRGSLDYCARALKKEDLKDPVKKDLLLTSIYFYLKDVVKFNDLILDKPEVLSELNLGDLMEKFDHVQDVASSEMKILPRLDDDNIDLELFLEDKDEEPASPLLTSTF